MSKVFYEGFASRCIQLKSEEGKAYVTLNVKDFKHGGEDGDEEIIFLVAGLFQHILKEHYSVHKINKEDIVLAIEIPEEAFREEVQAAFEGNGMMFRITDGPVEQGTNIVPKIIDRTEEEDADE